MSNRSVDLRARARGFENRESPRATRYAAEFREEVVALARERRALGVPISRIASECGLRARTVTLWLRTAPKRRLRRVKVAPETPASSLVSRGSSLSVSVGAVTVEGLDVESAVLLVRALS